MNGKKEQENREQPPLLLIYNILFKHYGAQYWWPAKTNIEIIIGAILTQNTSWKNVERAINQLKIDGLLEWKNLLAVNEERLSQSIRSAGYYNIKAKRIKNFIEKFYSRFDYACKSDIDINAIKEDTRYLRNFLLNINGIGPETADSILLYAFNRSVFVIDAYTKRIFSRHGWITDEYKYDDIAKIITSCIPRDIKIYNEYHALIVRLAKEYCRKLPLCDNGCPLYNVM